MFRKTFLSVIASMAPLFGAQAQEADARAAFVEANLLAIFYHELGHAVIDLMEVPIFGQEEDAADVMSVVLIDWLFEEDAAQDIAYDSAIGFINDPEQTEEVAYWDLHGPDEQRYYNYICLFYGANPDDREDLAIELGLPEERAQSCPEEYDQAAASWGAVFDEMDAQPSGHGMVFRAGTGKYAEIANRVLAAEVSSMNEDFTLPQEITVEVASCDDPNAFYDPDDVLITICAEVVSHLMNLYKAVSVE